MAAVFAEEPRAIAHAMFLHQRLPEEVPIVVRTRTSGGLGALLDDGAGGAFPGIVRFPFLERSCTPATIEGGVREQLAEAVHEDYLAQRAPDAPPSSLARPWIELSDEEREDSRARVDGIIAQLDAIGCDLVPLQRWGAPQTELTSVDIDALAEAEHERWRAMREAQGWTYGPDKVEAKKENPFVRPWGELTPEGRASNLESARNLQAMLACNGFEPVRRSTPGAP
ncbi:MAG: RyR domain-containing protein [Acidimicrobiales bacterium]